MAMPLLNGFDLVGGTNLSLRLGHRQSVDLDLFANTVFDTNDLLPTLIHDYPSIITGNQRTTSLQCWINEIKIDIVLHQYPYIRPVELIEEIRMVSVQDVIAMKLNAIAQRGAQKDFWDIAWLLNDFTIAEMLGFYKEKYSTSDVYHVVRSLTYFGDAENKMHDAVVPLKKMTWQEVKMKIENATTKFIKNQL